MELSWWESHLGIRRTLYAIAGLAVTAVLAWLTTVSAWLGILLVLFLVAVAMPALYALGRPAWLVRGLDTLAVRVPLIGLLVDMKKTQDANTRLVGDIDFTLRAYGHGDLAVPAARVVAKVSPWRRLTIEGVCKEIAAAVPELPTGRVLETMHLERLGELSRAQWEQAADEERVTDQLSRLLPDHPQVAHALDGIPRDPATEMIASLLGETSTFAVGFLCDEIVRLRRVHDRTERYRAFLEHTGLGSACAIEMPLVVQHLRAVWGRLPADPSYLWMIDAPEFAVHELDEVAKHVEDVEERTRLLGSGVFLGEREMHAPDLVAYAAHRVVEQHASDPLPVKMLHAYLGAKDRGDELTLGELSRDPLLWYRKAQGSSHGDEQLVAALQTGAWPTELGMVDLLSRIAGVIGSRAVTSDELEAIRRDIVEQLGTGPWSWASSPEELLRAVRSASAATPAHAEVREVDAYLLTFDQTTGSLAQLIDCLADPTDHQSEELERAGVELWVGDYRKYRFGKYTKSTRLGIVPPGMPFHKFAGDLSADLTTVLGIRKRLIPKMVTSRAAPPTERGLHVELNWYRDVEIECAKRNRRAFRITKKPAHGKLGTVTWVDDRRGVLPYVPTAGYVGHDTFEYRSGTGAPRTVELAVMEPPHYRLRDIDITLDRIDLEHCQELALQSRVATRRTPSVCKVWKEIEQKLGKAEQHRVKRLFDRIAGEGGCR